MATVITTINGTDVIANSRTDINNNFASLNTNKIETSTLDTDTSLTANSDSKIATQKAVKTFVQANLNPTGASWNEYAADAGANDSYVITLTGVGAYATGQTFKFKANTANTGACTLNVNGLGAKTIKKDVSSDLTTGDILANQIVTVIYDGTNMQIVSKLAGDTAKAPVVQTFTSNGTYTKTTGTKLIEVTLISAGGGGGGGSLSGGGSGGSGGGGGAINSATYHANLITPTVAVTVGTAGAKGGQGDDGTDGGASSFGSYLTASGGVKGLKAGGTAGTGGTTTGGINGGNGAVGAGASDYHGGGGGGAGGTNASGKTKGTAGTTSSLLGDGSDGSFLGSGGYENALDASNYGGGGGGGRGWDSSNPQGDGGNGGAGIVIVTEYY